MVAGTQHRVAANHTEISTSVRSAFSFFDLVFLIVFSVVSFPHSDVPFYEKKGAFFLFFVYNSERVINDRPIKIIITEVH